jgi:GNAT superfamily N-acetyltransferase
MPIPDGLHLRAAGTDDLPGVAELRERVGWAVHEWALRAVLEPIHARCLVAVDGANHVIGVGSGISYGALGVVGNMIVDPSHRRRGIGAGILGAVIDFLDERGCTRLELSATDEGRPLYEKYGFTLAEPGVSAVVPRQAHADDDGRATELTDAGLTSLAELAAYDAPRFGGDRSPLIARMLADPARPLVVARGEGGALAGWAWVRPEADRVGPLVADTPDVAAALVGDALRRLPTAQTVRLNVPAANRAGVARLRRLGAELEPWSGRMARGEQVPRREDTIYGNAVGALG